MNILKKRPTANSFPIFLIIKSCVPLTNILDFKIQTLRLFLNPIGRSPALLVKESLVTTSLKLFSIVGKRPYITTNLHSYGMKCPPDREDLRILSTRRAFFLLTSLFLCGYAPYFSNALRITSSQLNSIFIVWSSYR